MNQDLLHRSFLIVKIILHEKFYMGHCYFSSLSLLAISSHIMYIVKFLPALKPANSTPNLFRFLAKNVSYVNEI